VSQHVQMGRKGILGHRQKTSQLARSNALRLMLDQQPERFKPRARVMELNGAVKF